MLKLPPSGESGIFKDEVVLSVVPVVEPAGDLEAPGNLAELVQGAILGEHLDMTSENYLDLFDPLPSPGLLYGQGAILPFPTKLLEFC